MRHRIWSAALAAAALIMAAALPARASDNYPVRDGTGASQTFCSKLVGGLQYPCHLIYGMFGSTPTPVTTDGTNLNVHVQASELPSGAATAANQTSANTSLGQVVTQETALNTVLGLQADAAWSGSGSGSAIALQKYIAAKIEATRALLASTLTVNLPAGASTAANQSTEISSLSSIATNTAASATATNQTAVQANAGSDASKATAVQGCTSCKPVETNGLTPAYKASGVSAVTGTFTTATQSSSLAVVAGRPFNITLKKVSGTASIQLERQFTGDSNWYPLTAAGTQLYVWSGSASETASESEASVSYRLNVTACASCNFTYRLSQ